MSIDEICDYQTIWTTNLIPISYFAKQRRHKNWICVLKNIAIIYQVAWNGFSTQSCPANCWLCFFCQLPIVPRASMIICTYRVARGEIAIESLVVDPLSLHIVYCLSFPVLYCILTEWRDVRSARDRDHRIIGCGSPVTSHRILPVVPCAMVILAGCTLTVGRVAKRFMIKSTRIKFDFTTKPITVKLINVIARYPTDSCLQYYGYKMFGLRLVENFIMQYFGLLHSFIQLQYTLVFRSLQRSDTAANIRFFNLIF